MGQRHETFDDVMRDLREQCDNYEFDDELQGIAYRLGEAHRREVSETHPYDDIALEKDKVTERLRKYLNSHYIGELTEGMTILIVDWEEVRSFMAQIDKLDMDMAKAVGSLQRRGNEISGELSVRFAELPTDADGAPIHVGDRLDYDYGNDLRGTRAVTALILSDRWDFEFNHDEDTRDVADMSDFQRCNRLHRQTEAELLREFYARYHRSISSSCDCLDPAKVVDEYLAKLHHAWDAS